MTALLDPGTPHTAPYPLSEYDIPREGPYKILFERLTRLVRCRADLLAALARDPGNTTATAELIRIRHMINEIHRGVSINLEAKQLAARIDVS